MRRLFFALAAFLLMAGTAQAHGNISKLPNSVQVLQYRMLLYMDPSDNAVRNNLAMALYRTDKLDDAKGELETILHNDAADFNALDGMGIVLLKMGKYQNALHYLQKAMALKKDDMMVHVHLSAVYRKLGQPQQAAAELAKARSLAGKPEAEKRIDQEMKLITGS